MGTLGMGLQGMSAKSLASPAQHVARPVQHAPYLRRPRQSVVVRHVLLASVALFVSGCSESLPSLPKLTDLNPWAEKPVPLPGKRVAIIAEGNRVGGDLASADRPMTLPAQAANDSWAQPGGGPSNSGGHLAFGGAARQIWSADVGQGSGKYGKLSASPIVADGRVYTLDAAGKVSAFNASSGSVVWRTSITPEGEKNPAKGYGGGLAYAGGRVFAVSGYGAAVALEAASGKKLWERPVGVPIRSSPTATADRVFFVTTEGELYALSTADGAENWKFKGEADKQSFITNVSPAIDGDTVVAPFVSGDVVAVKIATGQAAWTESLARTRTASSMAAMSDAARPAIDSGVVFAIGHAGRMVATQMRTGERLWSLTIPSVQQPWVAGDSVFVADTSGQLMAITRRDGKVAWTMKLPGDGQWSGPVLAGNRLWVVSSKGQLAGVDPATGKTAGTQDLGAPAFIAPVVAGGRMYVLTDKGRLVAYN
jgi:outer membrane protein assembly factor BamB